MFEKLKELDRNAETMTPSTLDLKITKGKYEFIATSLQLKGRSRHKLLAVNREICHSDMTFSALKSHSELKS